MWDAVIGVCARYFYGAGSSLPQISPYSPPGVPHLRISGFPLLSTNIQGLAVVDCALLMQCGDAEAWRYCCWQAKVAHEKKILGQNLDDSRAESTEGTLSRQMVNDMEACVLLLDDKVPPHRLLTLILLIIVSCLRFLVVFSH